MDLISFPVLKEKIQTYIHKKEDLKRIDEAYQLALFKHEGQYRRSGDPYITHPVAVCYILAELSSGPNTLIAALLHDLVEDTDTTLKEIDQKFGDDVKILVDGVTKISKLSYTQEISQAENHQKMLLAMSKDIRVILIKIADRLHNMRTIDHQVFDKRIKIANETLDIYAPLAHRLGLFNIKAELEDISLKAINPPYFYRIRSLVENEEKIQTIAVEQMTETIKKYLKEHKINKYEISGRTKSIYSIYKKMVFQNRAFEDIYDILAMRIIVDKIETCYQVLGIIHANFVPIPKRFKDYIAVPKPNMYQSLHTTVLTDNGSIFEIQIRTEEMDKVAEFGVAAHWAYKEGKAYSKEKEQFEIAQKLKWYSELLKMSEDNSLSDTETASEFVESVKADILSANVYVFTPRGQVIELTRGCTPIDFAYRIHTDIGDKAVGAIVNNRIVPLDYELQTGDVVNIRTNKNSPGPSEDWLKIVKSNHARHKIRNFLNRANRDKLYQMGKDALEREAISQKAELTKLDDEFVKKHFSKNKILTVEALYVEIGKGILSEKTVIARLLGKELDKEQMLQRQIEKAQRILTTSHESGIVVEGLTMPQIKIANCCLPVLNDPIVGFVTRGSGIAVHHKNCPNLNALPQKRLIDVFWATNVERRYPTRVQIVAVNRENIVADVISSINALSISIAEINAVVTPKLENIIVLKVLVKNLDELEKMMLRLMNVSDVYTIERKYI
ncbi:MAG: bifunctional (p)ppGpp synthetase/guanosine-3',5'-bis(diphosphate) 3'-pyrophosphohydrolase [Acholeplasmataceae bacterium]|nr:bifunctional (p)ppGpp synthetase/guanosine-3',5'-bis(diphosphate) 3'-pyrophosphohydrolase [Acholeplasmataceae bacterium]